MLLKPLLGTDLSGKLGGIVASHNAGGAYFRAASIPTNPNTPEQGAVRDAVASLSNQWNNGLTAAQRLAWEVYADNVTVTNRIGEQIHISGMAHYVRSNVARIQLGVAEVPDGPTTFNLGSHTRPTLTGASEATQTVDFNFGTDPFNDEWANVVGGFMLIYLAKPQNASINYFRGPYRLRVAASGDPVPPVSPAVVAVEFAITAGQKLFGRAISTNADGRYSTSSFLVTTVGA